jgi:hypothetical protein
MAPKIVFRQKPPQPPPQETIVNVTIDDDDDEANALKGASGQGYLWEEAYKRSWDVLEEDEDGSLRGIIANLAAAQKRRRFSVAVFSLLSLSLLLSLCCLLVYLSLSPLCSLSPLSPLSALFLSLLSLSLSSFRSHLFSQPNPL